MEKQEGLLASQFFYLYNDDKAVFYCMIKWLLIFILFFCGNNFITAQTPMIDSLRKELVKQKADSIKVHDRIRISWYLFQVPDSVAAWKYINEGDSIADRSKNPILKGIVYEHMGYLHSRIFSKKAITFYLQAENILRNFQKQYHR